MHTKLISARNIPQMKANSEFKKKEFDTHFLHHVLRTIGLTKNC